MTPFSVLLCTQKIKKTRIIFRSTFFQKDFFSHGSSEQTFDEKSEKLQIIQFRSLQLTGISYYFHVNLGRNILLIL